ncbi:MAG TPA: TIGR02757 family protein [Flavisolibacter sp.]|nr:TIGR02757 family protein [Flavisolibacter sp.]
MDEKLKAFLEQNVAVCNQPSFIAPDPISVPHRFTQKQDIEIAAFFASIFAWGNRTTIINKTNALLQLMDDAPHQFCLAYDEAGLKRLLSFRHRTFNTTDLLYFVHFLHHHYSGHQSLESAFSRWVKPGDDTIENALTSFHRYFFSLEDAPSRTKKHIATPERGSTCKRLCMFLRWMVRRDNCGVDFGIWQTISPAQLVCPVDLHVARVARQLGLITRKQTDWLTALELTGKLKLMDPHDPAKYDFALFGLGVMKAPAHPSRWEGDPSTDPSLAG